MPTALVWCLSALGVVVGALSTALLAQHGFELGLAAPLLAALEGYDGLAGSLLGWIEPELPDGVSPLWKHGLIVLGVALAPLVFAFSKRGSLGLFLVGGLLLLPFLLMSLLPHAAEADPAGALDDPLAARGLLAAPIALAVLFGLGHAGLVLGGRPGGMAGRPLREAAAFILLLYAGAGAVLAVGAGLRLAGL